MNKRKDKILYNLWITGEEEDIIKKLLDGDISFLSEDIGNLILNIIKRGDLEKR